MKFALFLLFLLFLIIAYKIGESVGVMKGINHARYIIGTRNTKQPPKRS